MSTELRQALEQVAQTIPARAALDRAALCWLAWALAGVAFWLSARNRARS